MADDSNKRVIKKYANRRLYDTEISKHVTTEGIRLLVLEGHDVQVIDETTGDDITRHLLLQIIAEQEQGGRPLLDTALLAGIIRYYGHPMQEMMGHYLTRSMENYLTQQQTIQQQMAAMLQPLTAADAMQTLAKNNIEAWQNMQKNMFGSLYPDNKDRKQDTTPGEPPEN